MIFLGLPRFDSYVVEVESGCWLWTGSVNHGGYPKFWWEGRTVAAHRFAYERVNGPIPAGLTLDHLCAVRRCVRPRDLEAVTIQENLLRSPNRPEKRTHCPARHEYSPENTYRVRVGGRVERQCRTCVLARKKVAR